jgi:hypothetical protein
MIGKLFLTKKCGGGEPYLFLRDVITTVSDGSVCMLLSERLDHGGGWMRLVVCNADIRYIFEHYLEEIR